MKLLTSSIVILVLMAVSIGTASGATLILSDKGPGAGPIMANPVITPVGGTNTLYLWADVGTLEILIGIGVDIVADTPSAVSATAVTVENPSYGVPLKTRWNSTNPGTPGSPELVGIGPVSVNQNGLYGGALTADSTYDVGSGFYLVASVDYTYNGGQTDVFIESNATTVAYLAGYGGPLIGFGSGDAQVDASVADVRSTGWDAQIVPEPVTMTLLAMGGIAVLLRKRR